MVPENLEKYNIILGSGSPRRKELLAGLDLDFEVQVIPVDESYPAHLQKEEIAEYLAKLKSDAFDIEDEKQLIITADTIVCAGNEVLNKPSDSAEATAMLTQLSGATHEVITGVCLRSAAKQIVFHSITEVHFHTLTSEEIGYYIEKYQPFDKAGSYGIQEWIGHIGIQSIKGDYFNVVGLPLQALWQQLKHW